MVKTSCTPSIKYHGLGLELIVRFYINAHGTVYALLCSYEVPFHFTPTLIGQKPVPVTGNQISILLTVGSKPIETASGISIQKH